MSAKNRALPRLMGECARDPLEFVRRAYRWDSGDLAGCDGPRAWQAEVLGEIGAQLHGPSRLLPIRVAVASGHGIGKSALVAWLGQWALATRVESRVVVTANTETQLRTKTWPEMAKWYNRLICRQWFRLGAHALSASPAGLGDTWRLDRLTWSAHNPEAFAGLHNAGKRIVVIYDEASTIADRIWEVTEGALTDADTEILWIAFGNPTRNTGRFRECFGRHRNLWTRRQIDSRDVEGANRALAAQWVETWGEDSDFVRVRVKGEFPRAGSLQFIASDRVDEAMRREVHPMQGEPLVLGVDVARFGDDRTVIQPRRGLDARTIPAQSFRGLDTMQVAARVMAMALDHRAAAVFVDEGGVGAGVVDRLRQLRCPGLNGVNFGARADRAMPGSVDKFANKRAEMWGLLKDWLATGAIADDPDLRADLTGVEYGYDARDAILLEAKDDMKARGLSSPDTGDALALTFAYPVTEVAVDSYVGNRQPHMMPDDWEPGDDWRTKTGVNMLPDW